MSTAFALNGGFAYKYFIIKAPTGELVLFLDTISISRIHAAFVGKKH